jgi:Flp pilus assembly protein TadG
MTPITATNSFASSEKEVLKMLQRDLSLDKGQAFVELALVLPVFMMLLVGVVVVGRLAYASIEVSNAARAGAAYAAQTSTTAADSTNITLAAKQDGSNIISSDLTVTPTYSCSCESNTGTIASLNSCSSADANLTTCGGTSRIVVVVQVNTSAPVGTLFHLPGIPSTVTLRGQAIMKVQQ